MTPAQRFHLDKRSFAPAFVGVWAAAFGIAPGPQYKLLVAAPPLLGMFAWWTIRAPERWLCALFLRVTAAAAAALSDRELGDSRCAGDCAARISGGRSQINRMARLARKPAAVVRALSGGAHRQPGVRGVVFGVEHRVGKPGAGFPVRDRRLRVSVHAGWPARRGVPIRWRLRGSFMLSDWRERFSLARISISNGRRRRVMAHSLCGWRTVSCGARRGCSTRRVRSGTSVRSS